MKSSKERYQNQIPTEKEELEKELKEQLIMSKNVGFHQGIGAAHAGPEFSSLEKRDNKKKNEKLVLVDEDKEPQGARIKNETDKPSTELRGREFKGSYSHDNLKTFKKSKGKSGAMKMERIGREETREALHKEVEEEPSWQDPFDSLDLSEN